MTRCYLASNERDKVFGILSLSSDAQSIVSIPDYALLYHDLLEELVTSMIEHRKDLDVLCLANPLGAEKLVPSWYPDLTVRFRNELNSSLIPPELRITEFAAPRTSEPVVTSGEERGILKASGFCIDIVDGVERNLTQ